MFSTEGGRSERAQSTGSRDPARTVCPFPLPLVALLLFGGSLAWTGCNALARAIGGGPEAGLVDAHVVYRLRPDCTTLLARTLRNGYSVMTPLDDGFEALETGLFEGPVREGQSVYRYYPPRNTESWTEDWTSVSVEVRSVQLLLPEARAVLDGICGPQLEGEASDNVPRLPVDQ